MRVDSVIGGVARKAAAGSRRRAGRTGGREAVRYDSKRPSLLPHDVSPMIPPDDRPHRRARGNAATGEPAADGDTTPSKTQRKAQMHSLQALGESLVALDARRFAELAADEALPERLVDAIAAARRITTWSARRRQLQYVGRLMRDVDPEPIRRRLDAWAQGRAHDAARMHDIERWRERLLADPQVLAELAATRPSLDRARVARLVDRARAERANGAPPHAYRELFRLLKALEP